MTRRERYVVVFHNVTGAAPSLHDLQGDVQHYCEVDVNTLRPAVLAAGLRMWSPRRDTHQAVVWDPKVVRPALLGKRCKRYHRSGTAEGWKIATPPRALVRVRWVPVVKGRRRWTSKGTHLLNDWPMIDARRQIVEERELPVLRRSVVADHGMPQVVGGDLNAGGVPVPLPGMIPAVARGNDRASVSHEWLVLKVERGPVVGVGPTWKHESIRLTLDLLS